MNRKLIRNVTEHVILSHFLKKIVGLVLTKMYVNKYLKKLLVCFLRIFFFLIKFILGKRFDFDQNPSYNFILVIFLGILTNNIAGLAFCCFLFYLKNALPTCFSDYFRVYLSAIFYT